MTAVVLLPVDPFNQAAEKHKFLSPHVDVKQVTGSARCVIQNDIQIYSSPVDLDIFDPLCRWQQQASVFLWQVDA